MTTLNSSVDISRNQNFALWNTFNLGKLPSTRSLKEIAFLAATALAVISSCYLTVNNSPYVMRTIAMSICANFIILPQFLKNGYCKTFKNALVVHLTTMGSFFVGWSLGIGLKSSLALLKMMGGQSPSLAFNVYSFVLLSLTISTIGGYLVPSGKLIIEKAKQLNIGFNFEARFSDLHKHLKETEKYFSTRPFSNFLSRSFSVYCASTFPDWFVLMLNKVLLSRNHSMGTDLVPLQLSLKENYSLEEFNALLKQLEAISLVKSKQKKILPDVFQKSLLLSLMFAFNTLQKKEKSLAVASLLSYGPKFIPNLISNNNFLSFFKGELLNISNDFTKKLANSYNQWTMLNISYNKLFDQVKKLEQEIKKIDVLKLPSAEQIEIKARMRKINEDYAKLRVEIETIHSQKRIWSNYASLWNDKTVLPFNQHDDLIKFLQNPTDLNLIDEVFNSMIKEGNAEKRTFIDHLHFLKDKLSPILKVDNSDDDEDFSACIFLGSCCGFRVSDYDVLQVSLNLNSKDEIDDALKGMGLAKEDDFYEKKICSRKGDSRNIVMQNLQDYFKKNPISKTFTTISPNKNSLLTELGHLAVKVTRMLFYLFQSGTILVPVLLFPEYAAAGFALGSCYFILQRFNIPGSKWISDKVKFYRNSNNNLKLLYSFFNQRYVFTLTDHRIQHAQQFLGADIFGKMRLIQLSNICSIFNMLFPALNFFQGITLADEMLSKVK